MSEEDKVIHPLELCDFSSGRFFLDSGAHSIYTEEVIKKKGRNGYAFYKSDEFKAYVDKYARFVKRYEWSFDHYANVDAIFNAEISYDIQKYLEKEHGLKPVPVIHFGTPVKWIKKYLDEGYTYLGIGGLGQQVTRQEYYGWADQVFSLLCPSSNNYIPIVKTHGFAMTSWSLLFRYPWYSVDSTSWLKSAVFGTLYVPHRRNGEFVFTEKPYSISVSQESPDIKTKGRHLQSLTAAEKRVIGEWLAEIKVPLGVTNEKGERVEKGIINHHGERIRANLHFFHRMTKALPEWPWAYKRTTRKGFF